MFYLKIYIHYSDIKWLAIVWPTWRVHGCPAALDWVWLSSAAIVTFILPKVSYRIWSRRGTLRWWVTKKYGKKAMGNKHKTAHVHVYHSILRFFCFAVLSITLDLFNNHVFLTPRVLNPCKTGINESYLEQMHVQPALERLWGASARERSGATASQMLPRVGQRDSAGNPTHGWTFAGTVRSKKKQKTHVWTSAMLVCLTISVNSVATQISPTRVVLHLTTTAFGIGSERFIPEFVWMILLLWV